MMNLLLVNKMHLVSCTDVTDISFFVVASQTDLGDKNDVKEVLDGDININTHISLGERQA